MFQVVVRLAQAALAVQEAGGGQDGGGPAHVAYPLKGGEVRPRIAPRVPAERGAAVARWDGHGGWGHMPSARESPRGSAAPTRAPVCSSTSIPWQKPITRSQGSTSCTG